MRINLIINLNVYNTVMRRVFTMLFILILAVSLSCRAFVPESSEVDQHKGVSPVPATSPAPQISSTSTSLRPSALGSGTPAPTLANTPEKAQNTPTTEPISPTQFTVQVHPDGGLYVGDLLSFEVITPSNAHLPQDAKVQISIPSNLSGAPVSTATSASATFQPYGIQGRLQATLLWAWDTHGLSPGAYSLTFSVSPGHTSWTETFTLQPASELPPSELQAHWATARSQCCTLYYITGTAVERDIPTLLEEADAQARDAIQRMGVDFNEPITMTLMPRVLGHGGFASDTIQLSYLDRNYSSVNFPILVHHEMIHILDARLGGDFRPTMLIEGLAVYQSGGHFKPEPLLPARRRASAPRRWWIRLVYPSGKASK